MVVISISVGRRHRLMIIIVVVFGAPKCADVMCKFSVYSWRSTDRWSNRIEEKEKIFFRCGYFVANHINLSLNSSYFLFFILWRKSRKDYPLSQFGCFSFIFNQSIVEFVGQLFIILATTFALILISFPLSLETF